jgi:hypothetical protein
LHGVDLGVEFLANGVDLRAVLEGEFALIGQGLGVALDGLDPFDVGLVLVELLDVLEIAEPGVGLGRGVVEGLLRVGDLVGREAVVRGEPVQVRLPGRLELLGLSVFIADEAGGAFDVGDVVAKERRERAGRGPEVALGAEGFAVGRIDLFQPFIEKVPADRGPQKDQEERGEEAGIIATRDEQGRPPLMRSGGPLTASSERRNRRRGGVSDMGES